MTLLRFTYESPYDYAIRSRDDAYDEALKSGRSSLDATVAAGLACREALRSAEARDRELGLEWTPLPGESESEHARRTHGYRLSLRLAEAEVAASDEAPIWKCRRPGETAASHARRVAI